VLYKKITCANKNIGLKVNM